MTKIIPVLMLLIIVTFISVSCASKPKTTDDTITTTEEAITTTQDAIEAAQQLREPRERARAARQRAIDFEVPAYNPSDWESLEARYIGLQAMTVPENIQEVIGNWSALAESYDALFERTIPLLAQAKEDELMVKREELIETGFTKQFPQYLENADNITLEALDQYEAGEYYKARDTAAKALEEYEILLKGARVFLARQEILDRDFAKYDEENFSSADDLSELALAEFDAGNRESAIQKAEEALTRYNLVISNGWTVYVAEQRRITMEEKERAQAERANIASPALWRDAEALFNQGERNLAAGRHHDAGLQYIEAEAMYILARQDTVEKRERALAAMGIARERIEESDEAAIEAERVIEGGPR